MGKLDDGALRVETGRNRDGRRFGFALDKFNNRFALKAWREGKDGNDYVDFVKKVYGDEVGDRAFPLQVVLGHREEAIHRLKTVLRAIEGSVGGPPYRNPSHARMSPAESFDDSQAGRPIHPSDEKYFDKTEKLGSAWQAKARRGDDDSIPF
jgi:hypothetical protein